MHGAFNAMATPFERARKGSLDALLPDDELIGIGRVQKTGEVEPSHSPAAGKNLEGRLRVLRRRHDRFGEIEPIKRLERTRLHAMRSRIPCRLAKRIDDLKPNATIGEIVGKGQSDRSRANNEDIYRISHGILVAG
jgi:hypothetical protein